MACAPSEDSDQPDVSIFSESPLIGSFSNLQVMRTCIKARMSSNLGPIGLFTLERFALDRGFFSYRLIMKKMMSPFFLSYYDFSLHLFILL